MRRRLDSALPPAARRSRWLVLVVITALAACDPAGCGIAPDGRVPTHDGGDGGDVGDGDDDGGVSEPPVGLTLTITPSDVLLETDGESQPTQPFTVTLTDDTGYTTDVTYDAELVLEGTSLGAIEAGVFTSNGSAGSTRVIARHADLETSASLVVRRGGSFTVEPPEGEVALPSDPDAIVESAPLDQARAPFVAYPADGVLLPPNLRGVEVQFTRGTANELFTVRFDSEGFSVRVHMRCTALNGGCVYVPDDQVWDLVTEAHAGGDPVQVRVIGTDDHGTARGESAPISLSFSTSPMAGGLYYWTSSDTSAIMRVDFGTAEQAPEPFLSGTEGSCIGCHALSPNGRKMTLSGQSGIDDGKLMLVNVTDGSLIVAAEAGLRERFQSWDPTSKYFAAVYGADPADTRIRIRDGESAAVLSEIDIGAKVTHPDWSPDGDRIYFTSPTLGDSTKFPLQGEVAFIEREAGAWGAPQVLVPAVEGMNRYYPAASPDGSLVAFNESSCVVELGMSSCDAVLDPTATLWAVAAAGGEPVLLERANHAGAAPGLAGAANSFPKWAPFVGSSRQSARVLWLSFASPRKAGLRDPFDDLWLWVVAVDPDRVLAGEDGSYAAFALPSQDFATSNHVAQWTQAVVKD